MELRSGYQRQTWYPVLHRLWHSNSIYILLVIFVACKFEARLNNNLSKEWIIGLIRISENCTRESVRKGTRRDIFIEGKGSEFSVLCCSSQRAKKPDCGTEFFRAINFRSPSAKGRSKAQETLRQSLPDHFKVMKLRPNIKLAANIDWSYGVSLTMERLLLTSCEMSYMTCKMLEV